MELSKRLILFAAAVAAFGSLGLTGCSNSTQQTELIVELHGADDTVWISGPTINHRQLVDDLRRFALAEGWHSFSINDQPTRVGVVTTLGRRVQGQSWSYEVPASRLLEAVSMQPSVVRFGVKHNRLADINTKDQKRLQSTFLLDPYPTIWYESTPVTFRADSNLFPFDATRKAIGLWVLLLLCSVTFAWAYISRPRGSTGNLLLGFYYGAAIATFLVYFLTGLAFVWTWLAPSRLAGLIIGTVPPITLYVLTTAVVIGDYLSRSKRGSTRNSLRHVLRRSAISCTPPLIGVIVNAILTVVLPKHYVEFLGGSATTMVVTQTVILLLAFVFSPVFLRWVYRPLALRGHHLEVVQQFCGDHKICFHRVGYIPRDELSTANAFVAGILPTFRCLYFTEALLDELNDMELKAVIAHEVGHVQLHHFWVTILFSAGFGWMAVSAHRLLGIDGMSARQTVALVLTLLAYSVAFAGISRRLEYQADRFAATVLGSGTFLQHALDKLRSINSVRAHEVGWNPFATHPSISSRIRAL